MLARKYQSDVIVLNEVGRVDMSLVGAAFPNFNASYQAGENAHGGVLVLIRNSIPVIRVKCCVPNVCVLDLKFQKPIRIMGMYAPASKSWRWPDLSPFISRQCVVIGDFNVDLEKDGDKADQMLEWMDTCSVGAILPSTCTSLRADRTIDYALTTGLDMSIQSYEGLTTSDHKPLLGTIAIDEVRKAEGFRTVWSVFTSVLAFLSGYWEKRWRNGPYDEVYGNFIALLATLESRCREYFPIKHTRPSVPREITNLLAQSRALSFKAKRKGDMMLRLEARQLRNRARYELKRFQEDQLTKLLNERHKPGENCTIFWSKAKKQFRTASSTLRGFTRTNGEVVKDPQEMVDMAAVYYEKLFEMPEVVRPHPYVDAPATEWENHDDSIPAVTYPELMMVLRTRKKKQSKDIHGLSPYLLDKIPKNYWHQFVQLYNYSFDSAFIPSKFKEVRMILLAKKDAICTPDQTRPISLLDSFLKVQEKLFTNRFVQVLKNRGILPDNQSGFRAGYRLQTRVLLLVEQISSYMVNSAPVATVFVDFKSAFDQLWFEGCLGKLLRMGIPLAFVNWIRAWLMNRRVLIEIDGKRSKWIPIHRGGPQGSVFTPTLFITYHSDMADFIPGAMSFFFADDLAAVIAGEMGVRFTDQCIDLERRLQKFLLQLEYYSILAVQPINYAKTQAMFSARAVCYPNPMPRLYCGEHQIEWTTSFKYLGYALTTKLGWGNIIRATQVKVRQRTAVINSTRYGGTSSSQLRRVLFSTFVLPYFTWLFALYPLFTEVQQKNLNHLYFTLLKRISWCQCWNDITFAALFRERTLDDRCYAYWEKYMDKLTKHRDGYLLLEQSDANSHRSRWLEGGTRIACMYRSKRFVPHTDPLAKALFWMVLHGTSNSVIELSEDDLRSLTPFSRVLLRSRQCFNRSLCTSVRCSSESGSEEAHGRVGEECA